MPERDFNRLLLQLQWFTPSGLSAPSFGLPSLSGIGSAQVAACPVFASPLPATPQA